MSQFPDACHLEQIRSALWSKGSSSASVMIGAGFSRNAKSLSPSIPSFPDWRQLSTGLIDDLYPEATACEAERAHALRLACSAGGMLAIAEEYQAAFGKTKLHARIRLIIPDNQFEPGPLHGLLLSLPWAEVLTTNYDTLLERARRRVYQRRYDVITKAENIPTSHSPRIVKLHGSFPGDTPFICTEEDFRSYPRKFAPFVNLVQQTAMETVLCLLGFSGDDPNFLQWTGWVRDNLGSAAPQIYLCGLVSISTARRKVLQDRHVVPIDLSPIFPPSKFPDPVERHCKAVEWLLLSLESGKPPSQLHWPTIKRPSLTKPTERLPDLLPSSRQPSHTEVVSPGEKEDLQSLANQAIKQWKKSRQLYPGWLVLPHANRNTVWNGTESWMQRILPQVSQLPLQLRLEFLYELNWRNERCLLPLWDEYGAAIKPLLESINPFSNRLRIPCAELTPENENLTCDWAFVRTAWIELAFSVMRAARRELDSDNFDLWRSRLRSVINSVPDLEVAVLYEDCLWHITELDYDHVSTLLDAWPNHCEDPYWLVRKAGLCAEVGRVDDAVKHVTESLSQIRERLGSEHESIAWMSREAWAIRVARQVHAAFEISHGRFSVDELGESDREDELSANRCSPGFEWEYLEAVLEGPVPCDGSSTTSKVTFNGDVQHTFHCGPVRDNRSGYEAVSLIEQAGLPLKSRNANFAASLASSARERLKKESPELALGLLLREADHKAIDAFLDASFVARLSPPFAARIRAIANSAAERAFSSLKGDTIADASSWPANNLNASVMLLSRLLARSDQTIGEAEMRLISKLHGLGKLSISFAMETPYRELLNAVSDLASIEVLSAHLRTFASLPIAGEPGFKTWHDEFWLDPLWEIDRIIKLDRASDPEWDACIARLLRLTLTEENNVRQCALLRLARLSNCGILTNDERAEFGRNLWAITDPQTCLPAKTRFTASGFLMLPSPDAEQTKVLIRKACMSQSISPLFSTVTQPDGKTTRQMRSVSTPWMSAFYECAAGPGHTGDYIDWAESDCSEIIQKTKNWWEEEGSPAAGKRSQFQGLFGDPLTNRIVLLVRVLSRVVAPRLKPKANGSIELCKLIFEMTTACGRVHGLPAIAYLDPESQENVIKSIRSAVVGNDAQEAESAIHAIYLWGRNSVNLQWPSIPGDLIHELGSMIASRRHLGLWLALNHASALVRDTPSICTADFLRLINLGLDYLLTELSYTEGPSTSRIPGNERLRLRIECARLAHTMHKHLDVNHEGWLKESQVDALRKVQMAAADD